MAEDIWYRDIGSFLNFTNLPKFYPVQSMTFAEQLNAIMRFSIFFSLVLLLVKRTILVFYIVLFFASLTFFLFEMYAKNKKNQKELFDKLNLQYDKGSQRLCMRPTQNNPFMNVLMNEYTEFPNRPSACKLNNRNITGKAEAFFDKSLYRDVDDIWSRKTSSRNWHTTPVTTIPNDRKSFTDWVYDMGPTCKEGNGGQCYKNMYTNMKVY